MPDYLSVLQHAILLLQALEEPSTHSRKRHMADTSSARAQQHEEVPLLERDAGAIKGYYVVIIILSLIIVFMTIAWFYFLYYVKRRLAAALRR